MKTCTKCGRSMPIERYYKSKSSKDGYRHWCKDCFAEDQREWKKQNTEKVRQRDVRFRKKNREKLCRKAKQYATLNKKKITARRKIENAIRYGKIKRPTVCEVCLKEDSRIIGHHFDYDKPMDVIWVCRQCHGSIHQGKTKDSEKIKQVYRKKVEAA